MAEILSISQATYPWFALDYVDRSVRADVVVGGVEYARESVTLRAEVYG